MTTYRTYRQIAEMDAIRRSDTLRQCPRLPSAEFVEMSNAEPTPGGFFLMLGLACVVGLGVWALLVILFSVVTG
jgi:hypothetical protein